MYKKIVRKHVGKIANDNITPLFDNHVMVKEYRHSNITLAQQIKMGTIWSIYPNQKDSSVVHGPIKGFVKQDSGKYAVIIDNILPPRIGSFNKAYRHEFYE
jgi:membrane protease subunit (stomatin/prohibitin family)